MLADISEAEEGALHLNETPIHGYLASVGNGTHVGFVAQSGHKIEATFWDISKMQDGHQV